MAAERAVSNQDVRHRMVTSFVWEMPFGKGKRFGSNWNPVLNTILGGWQLNGIVNLQSGQPIALVANSVAGIGNATQRVNIVPGQEPQLDSSVARQNVRDGKPWFNLTAFSQPAAFTFGNASRNIDSLRRDGLRNTDFSIFKKFKPVEKMEIEFRAEMFNAFNQVVFGAPTGSVTSTQFGRITAAANAPRVVQFGMKISF
jgi:hypothetical protein